MKYGVWWTPIERRFNALSWLALEEKCKNWLVFMRPPHLAEALHIWTRPQLCTETGDPARLPAQLAGRWGQRHWNSVLYGEGKKYFVLGRLGQSRWNKALLYWHDKPKNQPKEDLFHMYSLSPRLPEFQQPPWFTHLDSLYLKLRQMGTHWFHYRGSFLGWSGTTEYFPALAGLVGPVLGNIFPPGRNCHRPPLLHRQHGGSVRLSI